MAAIAVYVAGMQVSAEDEGLGILALGMLAILGAGAIFAWLDWLAYRMMAYWRSQREIDTITAELRNLQVIEHMRPEAIQMVLAMWPMVSIFPGSNGPEFSLEIGGAKIPYVWIDQFLRMGDGEYLCPVRMWSDGSREREWANLLTNWMVMMGFAAEARGMRPARWIERTRGLAAIGILEDGQSVDLITSDFIGDHLERRRKQRELADRAGGETER